jgi:hypothetical protein
VQIQRTCSKMKSTGNYDQVEEVASKMSPGEDQQDVTHCRRRVSFVRSRAATGAYLAAKATRVSLGSTLFHQIEALEHRYINNQFEVELHQILWMRV